MAATRAAVLGSPIAHSLSPVLHSAGYRELGLTDWSYQAIECDEQGLAGLLDSLGPDWAGLSLTMPLKRAVLPLLDSTEQLALEVGAANTVLLRHGRRSGYNTDVRGMVAALRQAGATAAGPAVVLGGGATACSALAALREIGASDVTVAVRSRARAAPLCAVAARLGVDVRLIDFGPQLTQRSLACPDLDRARRRRAGRGRASSRPARSQPTPCSTSSMTPGRPRWPRRPARLAGP